LEGSLRAVSEEGGSGEVFDGRARRPRRRAAATSYVARLFVHPSMREHEKVGANPAKDSPTRTPASNPDGGTGSGTATRCFGQPTRGVSAALLGLRPRDHTSAEAARGRTLTCVFTELEMKQS